jgi:hypothetical protein
MTIQEAVRLATDCIIDGKGLSQFTTPQVQQMAAWAYHHADNCWISTALDEERASRKGGIK